MVWPEKAGHLEEGLQRLQGAAQGEVAPSFSFSETQSPARNMRYRGGSTYRPRLRRNQRGFPKRLGPVVAKQLSVEEPPQKEPPLATQDVTPGEKSDAGALEGPGDGKAKKECLWGPDLEADLQALSQPENGGECPGPDVKEEESLPNLKPVEVLEGGEGQPQV
ncbi:X antigen family member 3-like [Lemur catta]|uniref:X antigen family member 3-like n=1 Tax=Lemur catta TaxID=9447 RepID=UPI001E269C38|nr:X antigen family member 3-like [Lemur catta]XP_045393828.1 X antigen family member 3-like [Lemur catta]XP_045393830.1 X antigen family member 3-like [Lemur catta]